MAGVYQGERTLMSWILEPLENLLYLVAGINRQAEMD